jgi:hypothetical protein
LISRYLVIALALGAAGYRLYEGAWIEGIGLAGLGGGLICLKIGEQRPAWRRIAWVGFAVTALAIVLALLLRQRSFS